MNFFARWWLNKRPVIALLLVAGCAVAAPAEEANSRVSVVFIKPEAFTDARRNASQPTSQDVLRDLEKFLTDAGARHVPEGMKLNIWITDIDLAGDFELFRGPQADHVRITKGLYPPRIELEFELIDSSARSINAGKRNLTDIDYQLRSVYPREHYLRYEKDILRDWLHAEFGNLRSHIAEMGEPSR